MVVGSKATDESVAKIISSVRPATGLVPPSLHQESHATFAWWNFAVLTYYCNTQTNEP